MSRRLTNKSVFVSGGASGLGADQVRGLSREGACVVFGDLREDAGRALESELRGDGHRCMFIRQDVSVEEDWRDAFSRVREAFGRLDVLVNNAGIVLRRAPIEALAVEDWDRVMAVNLRSVFLAAKHAIPIMRGQGGGSVVNISSLAANAQAQIQEPAYAASKAAVARFTKVAAAQHANENIRFNSLHPGPTDGGMLRHTFAADAAALAKRLERVPMGRLGAISEIVAGVIFLASDDASYMTGAELTIDGGASVQ